MIIQTNTFTCEKCNKVESTSVSTSIYDDPVVIPPREGWWYDEDDRLCCPECIKCED
jgi:hypothetical protein